MCGCIYSTTGTNIMICFRSFFYYHHSHILPFLLNLPFRAKNPLIDIPARSRYRGQQILKMREIRICILCSCKSIKALISYHNQLLLLRAYNSSKSISRMSLSIDKILSSILFNSSLIVSPKVLMASAASITLMLVRAKAVLAAAISAFIWP